MAESHKFSNLGKALEVFPELTWAQDGDGNTYVDNSKTGERVPVKKGQYVVKIADRYEVHDEEPANAKTAEKPADPAPAKDQTAPQVEPQDIGAPAGEGTIDTNTDASAPADGGTAAPAAE